MHGFVLEKQNRYHNNYCFTKILDESICKPKEIWLDKSNEFCNKSVKSRLQGNYIESCLIYNERKYAAAERFMRTS